MALRPAYLVSLRCTPWSCRCLLLELLVEGAVQKAKVGGGTGANGAGRCLGGAAVWRSGTSHRLLLDVWPFVCLEFFIV